MVNRELYTSDGREWFEPANHELTEEFTVYVDLIEEETCMDCGKKFSPGANVMGHYLRRRTWTRTGGISGKFSEWQAPEILGVSCVTNCVEIPL